MLSVSDMLKILDQVPIWKTLRTLPARVEALERRVAELEAAPEPGAHLHRCAECGAAARVTRVTDHPVFGAVGMKERTITCEAGHSHTYSWDPRKDP